MWWLLSKIEDIGLMREIWIYLTLQDVMHPIKSDKFSQALCLRLNSVVSTDRVMQDLNDMNLLDMKKQISSLTEYFSVINKISFEGSKLISNLILSTIYNNNSLRNNLREFKARVYYNGLKGISQMINLTSLDLSNSHTLKDSGLSELSSLTNLQSFTLKFCSNITGEGFSHFNHLTKITYLNLNFCGRNISDEGVFHITTSLTNLKNLDLTYALNVSNRGLLQLSRLVNMENINLGYSINLSDNALKVLLTSMTKLIRLDISNCTSLTILSIAFIASYTNLESLNIVNIALFVLTNENLIFLLDNLKSLNTLNISWTTLLTSSWLDGISESNIRELSVSSQKKIKDDRDLSIETINYLMHQKLLTISKKFKRVKGIRGIAYVRDLKIGEE